MMMDSPAIPVFLAGPFPVLHTSRIDETGEELELDVGILIGNMPNILASTAFMVEDGWERVNAALSSGDARLGVAGMPYQSESELGQVELFPSAYIGLECANGERLVLMHIRGLDNAQDAESYAREVIDAILRGLSPEDLGIALDD
jgi:hypothetical protein